MSNTKLSRELVSQQRLFESIGQALGRKTPETHGNLGSPEEFVRIADRPVERSASDRMELIRAMRENAAPAKLMVESVADTTAAATAILDLLGNREPEWGREKSICAWDVELIRNMGLAGACRDRGVELILPGGDDFQARCADSLIGVTTVDFVVAETGTMVLLAGTGRARTVSLLPSIHVALARPVQVVADFPELYASLARMYRETGLPPQFVLISGPSKTADIEATLVHGAHGPRESFLYMIGE